MAGFACFVNCVVVKCYIMDDLTFTEQIRVIMRRRGITVERLADMLETSKQNLNQQLRRDNFREKEMQRIAAALGCSCRVSVTDDGSGAAP